MTNRYQTGKIYRLLCEDGHYYIGSTTQALNLRFNTHKTLSKTKKERVYEHIQTIGWDKTIIELLEDCPCTTKEELNKKEKEHRSLSKSDPLCLNDSSDIIDIDSNNQTMYRNGKIYRLLCEDGHYYIGSTVSNLANCIANHRQYSAIYPNEHPYDYIAIIGWDKVLIELIEHYSCYSKDELDKQKDVQVNNARNDILCLNNADNNTTSIITNDAIVIDKNKYKNGKIYRLKCNDGHYCYGSTITTLDARFAHHKNAIRYNKHGKQYFYFSLVPVDTISIELVEEYECNTRKELILKESEYIIAHQNDPFCLNKYEHSSNLDDESDDDSVGSDNELEDEADDRYTNAKIYKLVCNDGHYYYGSTINTLKHRLNRHRQSSKTEMNKLYTHVTAVGWDAFRMDLIEEYPCISRVELYTREDIYIKKSLHDPLCLNVLRAHMSIDDKVEYTKSQREEANKRTKEYRAKNRDEILKKEAAYREANRTLLSEKQKEYTKKHAEQVKLAQEQYRESHKEQYKEYFKAYRKENQERIQERQKKWNQKKKEEQAEKIALERETRRAERKEQSKQCIQKDREIHTCECGGSYQFYQKNRHMLSKKHQTFMDKHKEPASS